MSESTTGQAAAILEKAEELPPIPAVAKKVLDLLENERTTSRDVEEVIQADGPLAARVLKITNSAIFGRSRAARTVSEAVTYLGFKTVRTIVLAAAMKSYYTQAHLADHLLWSHSLGVALASADLARLTRAVPADEALVSGLLHDLGKLVLKHYDPKRFEALMQQIYNQEGEALELEVEAFGVGHPEVADQLLTRWGFPEELRVPVALHHRASTHPDEVPAAAHVVCLANALCHHLGIGPPAPDGDITLAELPSAVALGVSAEQMESFAEEFPERFTSLRMMFD